MSTSLAGLTVNGALPDTLRTTPEQARQRGLVVIISDCFGDTSQLLRAFQHLRSRKHEVLLFHVLAPEEIEFPFTRLTQFRNLELVGDHQLVDPQQLRREYLANFERFLTDLRAACAKAQVDYYLFRTDEPVERALGLYLSRRQRQR